MLASVLADLVVVVHALFVVFAVFGGLLVVPYPRVIWLHIPALVWGAAVELLQLTCPLTPLEVGLRRQAGEAGYSGGFIEEYLLPILYPPGLGSRTQLVLGAGLVLFNLIVYGWVWRRRRRYAARERPLL